VQAALLAECAAAWVLIETAPTTYVGLRALERHLRDDRNCGAIHFIQHTFTTDGCTYTISGDLDQGVNRLIAKRAAEIAAEGH